MYFAVVLIEDVFSDWLTFIDSPYSQSFYCDLSVFVHQTFYVI